MDGDPRRLAGLLGGPLLAALSYLLLPDQYSDTAGAVHLLEQPAKATVAVAVWMATWWLTEAVAIAVTALLPIALFPLLGASDVAGAARPYGHPMVFLFMGGFMISIAMERWGLHARIALATLRLVGTRPRHVVGGFMLATAGLSMWVSNTATTVMMLPIAISVIELVERDAGQHGRTAAGDPFTPCLLLGIAYGASIGGMATIIGTPPNVFLVSYVREHFGQDISFARWLGVGLPVTVVMLPLAWLLLTRCLYRLGRASLPGAGAGIREAWEELGPMSRAERLTLAVFLCAVIAWITRPLLAGIEIAGVRPLAGLSDPGIAMLAALALFVLPADRARGVFVLDWEHARRLPWGILILFGGGLSLAAAIDGTGMGAFVAGSLGVLREAPGLLLVLAVTATVVFLTELTSNLATTATFIPILAAAAPALDVEPFLLIIGATLGASCAFMLPVATPPNAIVFGSGRLSIPQMSRAGIVLNLVGIAVVTLLSYTVALRVLGVRP